MSADRPTDGDSFPDRFSGGEDRPFPGAPEDREPAPELPKNTLSMDELRAVYQRSDSLAELQAAAKAHEEAQAREAASSGSPGPGSPDSAPVGERSADFWDGTDALGGRHPEELPQADEFPRPDLPPFPGAPEDREPAPELPKNTLSMDELRGIHQRSTSNAELEAMAAGYAADAKGATASELGGGEDVNGADGFAGRMDGARNADTGESDEQDSDDRARPGSRPGADFSQQAQQGEGADSEKGLAEQDEEFQEQKPNDQPRDQGWKQPDANPAQLDQITLEDTPDVRPDDQRPLTIADAKALIAEALAENNAKHEAELNEQKAKHEAETEELKAEYESRLSALEAKVQGGQEDQVAELPTGDRTPEEEIRPDAPDTADERSAEQRGDRLQRGTKEPDQGPEADSFADQGSAIGEHEERADKAELKKADSTRWRRIMTSENISATGTLGGAVNTVALFAMHATPEAGVTVALTALGLAGLVKAKMEKHRKDSNDCPDRR